MSKKMKEVEKKGICEISLSELLDSRERRAAHQKMLMNAYGGLLISMTLNIPGSVKDRPSYRRVLEIGMERLLANIPQEAIVWKEQMFLPTGPEAYMIIREDAFSAEDLKRLTVSLEDADDLGRLMDIDVLTGNGGISRADLGIHDRKCLICDNRAKLCARSQRHSIEDLLQKIEQILCAAGIGEQR